MSYISDYIEKNLSLDDYWRELERLIESYNKQSGKNLFIYCADIAKRQIREISIDQDDYIMIHDLLVDKPYSELDFYIETPGGSGSTAEDIVKFLRSKFNSLRFVISGESKSAGTIIAMSGDEIMMTETGALGPIDAQVSLGRGVVSASDYDEWFNAKHEEAAKTGRLNHADFAIIAQINPGELTGIKNSLQFAIDLVKEWLATYKFKNWQVTEDTKKNVTEEMRAARAEEIANELAKHSRWKTHSRSLKIDDLEGLGLKIINLDKDYQLSKIVYKIQAIIKIIFSMSNAYKIFMTENGKLIKHITNTQPAIIAPDIKMAEAVEVNHRCTKCNANNDVYINIKNSKEIDEKMTQKGFVKLPKNGKLKCIGCGIEIDLNPVINNLEIQLGQKIR